MKTITLCFITFTLSLGVFAQTNSTTNGYWSNASNWTSGVPTPTETVSVANDMILDNDININLGGNYTVSGSLTDTIGGSNYNISLVAGAALDIAGNINIEGDLSLIGLCTFTIRSGDTLTIGGNVTVNGISSFILENNSVLIVKGDFLAQNFVASANDGTIHVSGAATFNNIVLMAGNGSFQSNGSTTITNGSNVFGQTSGCPGGCQFGTGAGLPIVLADFTAEKNPFQYNLADVRWTTQSEINNSHFTLEYSTNGDNFEEVATINGAGNSNQELSYQVEVSLKASSTHYFRLSQTDFDGAMETFDLIALNTTSQFSNIENEEEFTLYPNPSNGRTLQLKGNNLKKGNYHLQVYNNNGRIFIQKSFEINTNESLIQSEIIDGTSLPKGLYFVKIQNNYTDFKQMIIVN